MGRRCGSAARTTDHRVPYLERSLSPRSRRWLPASILTLRRYTAHQLASDVLAGLTVGLVALLLAMAFAISSGMPPQAGIYCAIVTGFLISALGGSRVQSQLSSAEGFCGSRRLEGDRFLRSGAFDGVAAAHLEKDHRITHRARQPARRDAIDCKVERKVERAT